MEIERDMVEGLHALTPIEFIQELSKRVSETNYMVEEACTNFLESYDANIDKGRVDFLESIRYISGRIPISLVDTSSDINVEIDLYELAWFEGADGEYHEWEDMEYSGDDRSKYAEQENKKSEAIISHRKEIERLQKELDALLEK